MEDTFAGEEGWAGYQSADQYRKCTAVLGTNRFAPGNDRQSWLRRPAIHRGGVAEDSAG